VPPVDARSSDVQFADRVEGLRQARLASKQRQTRRCLTHVRLSSNLPRFITQTWALPKNREAAYVLAVFLARFWSAPERIVEAFHIDRRALAGHDGLDLTEKRIRSAIRTLEEVGFIDRAVTSGSKYKPTENGLHRKPIRFQFGSEYFSLFDAANKRAVAARGRLSRDRRAITPSSTQRPSTVNSASSLKGPKSRNPSERLVNLGPLVKECGILPKASESNPALEAALDRLLQGIRQSRGG
jgi:hypothetical protein